MEIYLGILLLCIVTVYCKGSDQVQSTDICQNSGSQLFCKNGTVLKIYEVTCQPYNYTCPERPKVLRLCNGQSSCASIGLKQQFSSFCQTNLPERSVIINYQCISIKHNPPCRTNICSQESDGLRCNHGYVIHIVKALCSDGDKECSWKAYHALFAVCETKETCHASGLRPLMPKQTCDDHFIHKANVFIDYICIENVVADETCTGSIIKMTRDFGIVKSPNFPNNQYGNPNGCHWAIYAARDQLIEVTIHLAFSREFTDNCNSQFLQVTYTDCRDSTHKSQITDVFCKVPTVNIVKRSCGNVYIKNWPYPAGEARGNRFLVSYQVKDMRSLSDASYHRYTGACLQNDLFVSVTSTNPYTNSKAVCDSCWEPSKCVRACWCSNESGRTGCVRHLGNNTYTQAERTFHPWRFLTLLKVIVINIFLFIIAVALIIAIVWVCYRYKQVSKVGKYTLSNQSDTDSGRRTNDTPLQTFSESASPQQGNSVHSFNYNERSPNTYASMHTEEPYATVDRSQYYPDASVNSDNKNGRGLSSFMAPQDDHHVVDPYASYSSLNYEVPTNRQQPYSYTQNSNNQLETFDDFPPPPEELQQKASGSTSDGIHHYTINDDDYAIVQKPRKQQTNNVHRNSQGNDRSYDNIPQNALHRPNRINQFQPEVGYLPQHKCMLDDGAHVCNVPPFNPSRHGNNVNHYHPSNSHGTWEDDFY